MPLKQMSPAGQHRRLVPEPQTRDVGQHVPLMQISPVWQHVVGAFAAVPRQTRSWAQHTPLTHVVPSGQHLRSAVFVPVAGQIWAVLQHWPLMSVVPVGHAHWPFVHGTPSGQHAWPQTFALLQQAPLTHLVPSGQHVTVPAEFVQACPAGQHRPFTHV